MVYSVVSVPVELLSISWLVTLEVIEEHLEEVIVIKKSYPGVYSEAISFDVLLSYIFWNPISYEFLNYILRTHTFVFFLGKWK